MGRVWVSKNLALISASYIRLGKLTKHRVVCSLSWGLRENTVKPGGGAFLILLGITPLVLVACGPSSMGTPTFAPSPAPAPTSSTPIFNQADTIGLEESDRINRFRRLAQIQGIPPPT